MSGENFETAAARIVVIGIGGGGCNAVNRMVDDNLPVEFYVMNTDLQTLQGSKVAKSNRIVLGNEITQGLGAGGDAEIGRKAAEASAEEIRNVIRGANMVFIAAGMGGGTGTGAAPVVANICKEEKALTIAVVTRPFSFEGKVKFTNSISGLNNLKNAVDSIIVISNDKLLMTNGNDSIEVAFQTCDQVLSQSVSTVINLILMPGIINLDFADIRKTLENSGIALIGYGHGKGSNKALEAAQSAIACPLLETPMSGARRSIIAVTCGPMVSLYEAQDCVNRIKDEASNAVDVKWGVAINEQLGDEIIVSIIASDFKDEVTFTEQSGFKVISSEPEEKKIEKDKPAPEEEKENENSEEDILPNFLKDKNID